MTTDEALADLLAGMFELKPVIRATWLLEKDKPFQAWLVVQAWFRPAFVGPLPWPLLGGAFPGRKRKAESPPAFVLRILDFSNPRETMHVSLHKDIFSLRERLRAEYPAARLADEAGQLDWGSVDLDEMGELIHEREAVYLRIVNEFGPDLTGGASYPPAYGPFLPGVDDPIEWAEQEDPPVKAQTQQYFMRV
jgi:hypothetical protein